jgi:hypothetical protein
MSDQKRITELEAQVAMLQKEANHYRKLAYKLWRNRDEWVRKTGEARCWARHYKEQANE